MIYTLQLPSGKRLCFTVKKCAYIFQAAYGGNITDNSCNISKNVV